MLSINNSKNSEKIFWKSSDKPLLFDQPQIGMAQNPPDSYWDEHEGASSSLSSGSLVGKKNDASPYPSFESASENSVPKKIKYKLESSVDSPLVDYIPPQLSFPSDQLKTQPSFSLDQLEEAIQYQTDISPDDEAVTKITEAFFFF